MEIGEAQNLNFKFLISNFQIMLIQFLVTIISAVIILFIFKRVIAQKSLSLKSFLWLAFWVVAIIIVWYPDLTNQIANLLGVGRGTDAVFYISLVVIFYLLYRILSKIDKQDQEITKIVRTLAINDSKNDKNENDGSGLTE